MTKYLFLLYLILPGCLLGQPESDRAKLPALLNSKLTTCPDFLEEGSKISALSWLIRGDTLSNEVRWTWPDGSKKEITHAIHISDIISVMEDASHVLLRTKEGKIVVTQTSSEGRSIGLEQEICLGHSSGKSVEEQLEKILAEAVPGYRITDYVIDDGVVNMEYHPNGKLKTITKSMSDATRDFYVLYDSLGQPVEELSLIKSPHYAVFRKFANNKLMHQSFYNKDWELVGPFTVHYPEGNLFFSRNYDDGVESGTETWYHKNGKMKFLLINKAGRLKGKVKVFDEQEKPSEEWDEEKWMDFRTTFEIDNPSFGLDQ